jgi:hypothetical protein
LAITAVFLVFGIVGFFFPKMIIVNNEHISIDQCLNFILASTVPAAIFFLLKDKFRIVTLNQIEIRISEVDVLLNWNEVEIRKIPLIIPPLYKIRVLESGKYYLFNTEPEYIWTTFGIVVDISSMGSLIRKMKKVNGSHP